MTLELGAVILTVVTTLVVYAAVRLSRNRNH